MIQTPHCQNTTEAGENPFATRFTRPGALPYLAPPGGDAAAVAQRLKHARWRGQIVGPHGTGKSTLLASLADEVGRLGEQTTSLTLDREHLVASRSRLCHAGNARTVLLVEGFDALDGRLRRSVLAQLARSPGGFVVTTHAAGAAPAAAAPVVASTNPNISQARSLFTRLTATRETPVTVDDLGEAFAARAGNLRDVWLDLYLLHESRRRGRTAPVRVAYAS